MPQEYQHVSPNRSFYHTKGLLLYILPSPLVLKVIISIISLNLIKILLSGSALFLFYSAAHLTRTTFTQLMENSHHHRPKKIKDYRKLAFVYVGVATLILAFFLKRSWLALAIMPICSMVGYYLVYGLSTDNDEQSVDFEAMPKATREAIEGAYRDLEEIEQLSLKLTAAQDSSIALHVKKVIQQSYKILELLRQSPNDAGRARRFLNVYVNRIKEILTQYIHLSQYGKAESYRQRLSDTLEETYNAFSEQESKLLDDDQFKLDVQLEVLDEQIKNEQKKL